MARKKQTKTVAVVVKATKGAKKPRTKKTNGKVKSGFPAEGSVHRGSALSKSNIKDGVRVSHSELVTTITSTAGGAFALQTLTVNPTQDSIWPLLAREAAVYTNYKFRKLVWEFQPSVGAMQDGNLDMAMSYDVKEPAPTNLRGMQSRQDRVSCPLYGHLGQSVKLTSKSSNLSKFKEYWVDILGQDDDTRVNDVGLLYYAAASTTSVVAGRLWAHYVVDLYTPRVVTSAVNVDYDVLMPAGVTGSTAEQFAALGGTAYSMLGNQNAGTPVGYDPSSLMDPDIPIGTVPARAGNRGINVSKYKGSPVVIKGESNIVSGAQDMAELSGTVTQVALLVFDKLGQLIQTVNAVYSVWKNALVNIAYAIDATLDASAAFAVPVVGFTNSITLLPINVVYQIALSEFTLATGELSAVRTAWLDIPRAAISDGQQVNHEFLAELAAGSGVSVVVPLGSTTSIFQFGRAGYTYDGPPGPSVNKQFAGIYRDAGDALGVYVPPGQYWLQWQLEGTGLAALGVVVSAGSYTADTVVDTAGTALQSQGVYVSTGDGSILEITITATTLTALQLRFSAASFPLVTEVVEDLADFILSLAQQRSVKLDEDEVRRLLDREGSLSSFEDMGFRAGAGALLQKAAPLVDQRVAAVRGLRPK